MPTTYTVALPAQSSDRSLRIQPQDTKRHTPTQTSRAQCMHRPPPNTTHTDRGKGQQGKEGDGEIRRAQDVSDGRSSREGEGAVRCKPTQSTRLRGPSTHSHLMTSLPNTNSKIKLRILRWHPQRIKLHVWGPSEHTPCTPALVHKVAPSCWARGA